MGAGIGLGFFPVHLGLGVGVGFGLVSVPDLILGLGRAVGWVSIRLFVHFFSPVFFFFYFGPQVITSVLHNGTRVLVVASKSK